MRLIWLVAEGRPSSSRMRPTLPLLTRSSRDGDIEPAAAGLAWGGVSNGMVQKKQFAVAGAAQQLPDEAVKALPRI